MSLCPQLSSTFLHYLSVRHILSPLVLCHTVHCSVQKSFHCLSEPYTPQSVNCLSVTGHFLSVIHTEPSFASVSLCPLVSSKIYPLSFSTSHCTACCSRVTMHSAIFCNMSKEWQYVTLFGLYVLCHHVHWYFIQSSTVCRYVTLYGSFVLCHSVHCCLLQSVHCMSIPHTVPSGGTVSLCPLVSSIVCPMSLITSRSTVSWFCVTVPTTVFFILSNFFQ